MDGHTEGSLRGWLTCHCMLVETDRELVLIDTGLGLLDVADPPSRLSKFFLMLLSPDFREEMTDRRQIERLGYDARDARHIVPSHLDFDHAGVAIRRERDWLFYAADAYFYHQEMDLERPRCTPGLRFYQWMMEKDRTQRLANQARLRQLKATSAGEVTLFCAHDPVEFELLAGHPMGIPVPRSEQRAPPIFAQPHLVR